MPEIRKPTFVDLSMLIASMTTWGLAFVAMKIVVPDLGPYWVSALRSGLGFLLVFPFALWIGLRWPNGRDQWLKVVLVAICMFIVPATVIAWGLQTLDAGVAALLMGTGPFMALFAGHFFTTDERFTLPKLIAVCFGFSGIALIVGPTAFADFGSDDLFAKSVLICCAAFFVTGGYTIRRINLPSLSLTAICLMVATIVLVPFSLAVSGPVNLDLRPDVILWLLFLGAIASGLAFVVRFFLIQRIGYAMFSIGVNLIPVSGVILGALILGEVVTLPIMLALMLVVGGLFIARLGAKDTAS
ncbi:MAG: DMT family transporter [Pseudomonadota bacterium]